MNSWSLLLLLSFPVYHPFVLARLCNLCAVVFSGDVVYRCYLIEISLPSFLFFLFASNFLEIIVVLLVASIPFLFVLYYIQSTIIMFYNLIVALQYLSFSCQWLGVCFVLLNAVVSHSFVVSNFIVFRLLSFFKSGHFFNLFFLFLCLSILFLTFFFFILLFFLV